MNSGPDVVCWEKGEEGKEKNCFFSSLIVLYQGLDSSTNQEEVDMKGEMHREG